MRELRITAAVLGLAALVIATTPAADQGVGVVAGSDVTGGDGYTAGDVDSTGADADAVSGAEGGSGTSPSSSGSSTGPRSSGSSSGQAASGGQGPGGAGGGRGNVSTTGRGAVGRGITDSTITVGIGWFDVNGARAAFGTPGQFSGNSATTKEGAERIIEWMNKNGGIAGRRIVGAYHEYPVNDIGTNDTRDRREQAMCSDWTEDRVAFAAIPYLDTQNVFYDCAAKHNLVGLSTNYAGGVLDRKRFAEIGHVFWRPNWIVGERRERIVVEHLQRRGFFTPGARVGLFLADSPPSRRTAESTLKPLLRDLGVNIVAEAYFTDLSDPMASQVFKFQSANVTHIVFGNSSCGSGICLALLQQAAENQQFRPKYGVGSDWGAGSAKLFSPPPAQMANTVSIGWNTMTDWDRDDYHTATPINEHDARCRKIIKDAGINLRMHLIAPYCVGLFFLKDGLERAPELTWQGFQRAVEGAGSSLITSTTYGMVMGPGRHDGATFVHDMAYDQNRQAWHYVGQPIPVG